jgi:hypothetical protein
MNDSERMPGIGETFVRTSRRKQAAAGAETSGQNVGQHSKCAAVTRKRGATTAAVSASRERTRDIREAPSQTSVAQANRSLRSRRRSDY